MSFLYEKLNTLIDYNALPLAVPEIISSNLREGYGQRPYQIEAFARFVFQMEQPTRNKPTQLLFHMATGSGKTLVMAGCILYLYQLGYRNFVFFVNSNNIIEKTRDNFLNTNSSKYLFREVISVNARQIRVREVFSFQSLSNLDLPDGSQSDQDINIVFTTIQGLHSRLNNPRENSISYEDFLNKKIALISDEAHHINADTIKGKANNKEELDTLVSWESTVNKIFRTNAENVLLEFTATLDVSNPDVKEKYADKIIFNYPLKSFKSDGYSKEVKVLQSDVADIDRALQGIILSQYRRKVFERNKIIAKPVIMFKSKTIANSNNFLKEFRVAIDSLATNNLERIKLQSSGVVKGAFDFFEENNITLDNLILELRNDFSVEKCISVNSRDDSEAKQLAINSLEDDNNEYRAVFAVDKLNEGWDVLNLFDIVRMYNTRDSDNGRPGKTTMSEAQLIGRGARYFPFSLSPDQSKHTRKFDNQLDHELRVCEELYYHSAYNPKYIQELNTALQEIGLKATNLKEIQLKIKPEVKDTNFYKKAIVYGNKLAKYDRSDVTGLPSQFVAMKHPVVLRTQLSDTQFLFNAPQIVNLERAERPVDLRSLGIPVIRKALNKIDFFRFANLRKYFPHLNSITEFVNSPSYLGNVKLLVQGNKTDVEELSAENKLFAATSTLLKLASTISKNNVEYKGTPKFEPLLVKDVFIDTKRNFTIKEDNGGEGIAQSQTTRDDLRVNVTSKQWYYYNDNYGTTEEKLLVKFIDGSYDRLSEKYEDIYLVRNDVSFKLYNFENGDGFEPDFLLFMTRKEGKLLEHLQIFIEPKAKHLIPYDEWKEKFIVSLKELNIIQQLWQNRQYIVWGLPFFNNEVPEQLTRFENEFKKLISSE